MPPQDKAPRPRSLRALVQNEPRCIYCDARPNSLEHMPPVWVFAGRQRPKGMEYATCKQCNNGTRAADLAAGFMARIRPFDDPDGDLITEAKKRVDTLDRLAPGLREEVFDLSPYADIDVERDGQVHEMVRIDANGPILAGLLTTFGAKLGMALYREHVGEALPMHGAVLVQPFMNGGLSQDQGDALLSVLPTAKTLRNGRREVSDQFAYAFNSDERSVVMGLASLHQNLHFLVLAASDPDTYDNVLGDRFVARVSPGELLLPRKVETLRPGIRPRRPYVLPGLPQPR
jgi:hypothetical protein